MQLGDQWTGNSNNSLLLLYTTKEKSWGATTHRPQLCYLSDVVLLISTPLLASAGHHAPLIRKAIRINRPSELFESGFRLLMYELARVHPTKNSPIYHAPLSVPLPIITTWNITLLINSYLYIYERGVRVRGRWGGGREGWRASEKWKVKSEKRKAKSESELQGMRLARKIKPYNYRLLIAKF
jgi:hypothetical protein